MKKQSTTSSPNSNNQFFATLALILFSINLSAATIYVKPLGDDQNTGLSWAQAYQTLSRALYMAANGDQIWVAAGTYKPATQGFLSCTPSFYVGKNVKIYGGFVGTETALAQRNFVNNITILSGDIGTPGDLTDNARLFVFDHVSVATLVDGFTLTDYRRSDTNGGGAVYNSCSGTGRISKPTIANCKFLNGYNTPSGTYEQTIGWIVNNFSDNGGDAQVTLTNCTFGAQSQSGFFSRAALGTKSNAATGKDKIVATNCTFTMAAAVLSVSGNIGETSIELTNSTFSGAYLNAFEVLHDGATPLTLLATNCSFLTTNTFMGFASSYYIRGFVNATFDNCVFTGITSGATGIPFDIQVIGSTTNNTTFRKCTFAGNSCSGSILNCAGDDVNLKLENCLFSGNACGGIVSSFNGNPSFSIINSTFAGNSGFVVPQSGGNFDFKNSILWGNAGGIDNTSGTFNVSHCIVQGGFAGTNNFNLDPLFLAPEPFANAPNLSGNYRLDNCSPASNTGNNSFVPAGLTTDLDNSPRIFGGATGKVDCGAFEKQNNLTQIAFADGDGDGYGIPNAGIMPYCGSVPTGFAPNTTDCNDAVSTINPGVAEVCNGLDDNCDGIVDNVTTCPKPINLSTSSITPTSALTNWTGGDCPISYQVQYRLSTVTTYTTITINAPATGLLLTNLMPGKTYRWRIRAVCTPGNKFSAYTALQTFSTPASATGGGNSTNFSNFEKTANDRDDAQQQFMSVFPNPSDGEFQIEFDQPVESSEVFLHDLQGKLILKTAFERGSNALTVRTGNLPAGIYLLRAQVDGADFRERVLVE